MKNIFKSSALIFGAVFFLSCSQQAGDKYIDSDIVSIELSAYDTEEVVMTVKSNVNWIMELPEWVKASAVFGRGDAQITLAFADNMNEDVRTGEIRITGGGALDGQGAILIIPVSQKGYDVNEYLEYLETCEVLGGIPDAGEFTAFIRAANLGYNLRRWKAEDGEVKLMADIDLSFSPVDWQTLVNRTNVQNGNNECVINNNNKFTGVFNGDNHTITGFNPSVQLRKYDTFGLFSIADGAVIKNLNLSGNINISASGQADAGMLVGTAKSATITNVNVSGSIISSGTSSTDQRFSLGGVCGFAYGTASAPAVIEKCISDVAVQAVCGNNKANGATGAMYGGIAAFATGPDGNGVFVRIHDCQNNGDMNVALGRCSGIVSSANIGVDIKDCVNNGDQINSIPNGRLGNIVCIMARNCSVKDCINNGDLITRTSGYSGTAGGMIALINHTTASVSGGGNYGAVKTSDEASRYGLICANLNAFSIIDDVKVGGQLWLGDMQVEINGDNYMDYIGMLSTASDKSKITGCTFDSSTQEGY